MSKVCIKYAASTDCMKEQIVWPCFIKRKQYTHIFAQMYMYKHICECTQKSQERSFKMSEGAIYITLFPLG